MRIMNLICAAVAAMLFVSGCEPADDMGKVDDTEQTNPGEDTGNGGENGDENENGGEQVGNEKVALADVAALTNGTSVTVEGTVMARYAKGFLVSDGKDNLLIYENNNPSDKPVGSKVRVSGVKATFGGQPQVQNVTSLDVTGTVDVQYPEPTVYTSANISALVGKKMPTYIQYTGVLNISGGYYNIKVNGADIQGSITYPENSLSAKLAQMNGKTITVTGYHVGMTGSNKYASTMAVSVVENEEEGDDNPVQEAGGWLELPAKGNVSTAKEYTFYAGQRNYTAYYDTKTYSSLWVAYPLAKGHTGSLKRPEFWSFAPGIDESLQVNLVSHSYLQEPDPHSRGHQIPNADRNGIQAMQLQTFYVINSTPQIQDGFNGDIWATLEDQIRATIPSNDTLYIVTGPVYQTVGGSESISYTKAKDDDKQVPIANYFFKAVLKVKRSGTAVTDAKAVGFWFDHKVYSDKNFQACAVTVDEIERKTGYDLFVNLPDNLESSAEQNSSWSSFKNF